MSSAQRTFHIEWGGEADLTIGEIWPNGDAPEDPTVEDVIAEMGKWRSARTLSRDWNLEIEGVEVNGKDSGLR